MDDREIEEILEYPDYVDSLLVMEARATKNIRYDGCRNFHTEYCYKECPLKPACHWRATYG